jgi:hypothetical protein
LSSAVQKEVFAHTVAGVQVRNAGGPGAKIADDIEDAVRHVRAQMWKEARTEKSPQARKR